MNKYSFNTFMANRNINENAELIIESGFPLGLFLEWHREVGAYLTRSELHAAIVEGWLSEQVLGLLDDCGLLTEGPWGSSIGKWGGKIAGGALGGIAGAGLGAATSAGNPLATGAGAGLAGAYGAHKGGQWGEKIGNWIGDKVGQGWNRLKRGAADTISGIGNWAKNNNTAAQAASATSPPPADAASGGGGADPVADLKAKLGVDANDPEIAQHLQFLSDALAKLRAGKTSAAPPPAPAP